MAIVETVWTYIGTSAPTGNGTKSIVDWTSDGSCRPVITNCKTVDYGAAIVGPIGNGAVVTVNAQVRVGADGGSGVIVTKATGVKN